MGVRFAPAIAGGGHFHEPRVERVLYVALEDAVFDQRGALGGIALVINIEGTATISDGPVIDDRDAFGCDTLTYASGESAGSLAVEVTLKSMTYGLVQQDAWPARSQHDGHGTRRCWS